MIDTLPIDLRKWYQRAHGFANGQPLRMNPVNGDYALAIADTEDHARVLGLVYGFVGADSFTLSKPGTVIKGLSGLVRGTIYYLSPTVAGGVTTTKPSVNARELYQAISATDAIALPQQSFQDRLEARTADPASPVVGQMWLRTDL